TSARSSSRFDERADARSMPLHATEFLRVFEFRDFHVKRMMQLMLDNVTPRVARGLTDWPSPPYRAILVLAILVSRGSYDDGRRLAGGLSGGHDSVPPRSEFGYPCDPGPSGPPDRCGAGWSRHAGHCR